MVARAARPHGELMITTGIVSSILAVGLLLAACASPARREAPARAPSGGRLVWLGGPTALLERGGFRLLTDPMLGPRSPRAFTLPRHPSTGEPNAVFARYTDPPAVSLTPLDAVILSHAHNDHIDARAREVIPKDTLLIIHPSIASAMREAGFHNLRLLDWTDSTTLERAASRVTITAIEAHHAHDPAIDAQVGKVNGYILAFDGPEGRYTVYWTGDSVVFDGQNEIVARFAPIDLLLPHMGGVGGDGPHGLRTMNADEAMRLIAGTRPRQVIPIHHTTFSHYREPVSALVQRVDVERAPTQLTVVPEGGTAALLR